MEREGIKIVIVVISWRVIVVDIFFIILSIVADGREWIVWRSGGVHGQGHSRQ